MGSLRALLPLVIARARRRPGRWLLPALGIAVAAAFLAGVAAEATVAGDEGARSVLAGLSPLDRSVRVTWQGVPTRNVRRQARGLLAGVGLPRPTEVVLLGPVRLGDIVVRLAAIAPLTRWVTAPLARRLGRCTAASCPMLLASPRRLPAVLAAAGVRIDVVGAAPLDSAVPLGFSPLADGGPPVLLTGDVAGLEAIRELSGVYHVHGWVATPAVERLHSWQLRGIEDAFARGQAALQASSTLFSLVAPFDGFDQARAVASTAPRRVLLLGGGAAAALALFVLLVGAGLRRDQLAEVDRLRAAGARRGQCLLFLAAESAWLSAVALSAGAGLGILATAILASSSGEPIGGVLTHSLFTLPAALALVGGWVAATVLMIAAVAVRGQRVIDGVAIAAAAGLVVGLAVNPGGGALVALLAPLCSVAAGIATFRVAAALLRASERFARDGPLRLRLALVGLARTPAPPSAAIAFVAISVGLGGFALAFRATVERGAVDQAADRVPLDAVVAPGPDFATPLELAPVGRWRAVAAGAVLPVRRTEANYTTGGGTVTIPALGIPARGLALIHGWRVSDGSAPLGALARRLGPEGPVRVPGPQLPAGARWLALRVSAATGVVVAADLRDPYGAVTQLSLGAPGPHPRFLRAHLPAGRWELEAFELQEPAGLEATNGHQNAENPAATTQAPTPVTLGPVRALGVGSRVLLSPSLGAWRAVGAAAPAGRASGAASLSVTFGVSAQPGVIRPEQPSDRHPVPVLADPQTAAAAAPGGRLALTVDGLSLVVRVVGELRRFPTLPTDAAGVLVADQATLSSALDARAPGQGRPDELWVSSAHPGLLRAALGRSPLTQLRASFRADLEHQRRAAPLARGVLGTLVAATAVSAALAVLGLLAALLGPSRDRLVERDLQAQGFGPSGLRAELRARLTLAGVLGTVAGLVVAVLLVRLAVATVRAATTVAVPHPALVTVVPWAGLAAWGAAAAAVLALCGSLAARAAR